MPHVQIVGEIFLSTKLSRVYLFKKIENKERLATGKSTKISLRGGDVLIYVNMVKQRNNLFI